MSNVGVSANRLEIMQIAKAVAEEENDGASGTPQKQLVLKPVASTVNKLLQPH